MPEGRVRDLVRDHRLDRRAASARLFGLTRSYWRLGVGCRTSKSFFPLAADAAGAEVKLLRRRQSEPEPVDREEAREEWADLLRRYRTRSSLEMRRELYHAQARKRQKARTAATTPTPTKGEVAVTFHRDSSCDSSTASPRNRPDRRYFQNRFGSSHHRGTPFLSAGPISRARRGTRAKDAG